MDGLMCIGFVTIQIAVDFDIDLLLRFFLILSLLV